MISSKIQSATTLLLACVLSLSLTGCTLATTAAPGAVEGTAISGKVHGGQQPVSGARIYLLAANPSGYGNGSLSLLTSSSTGNAVDSIGAYVSSNSTGGFDITGDYSCTTGFHQGASTASGGISLSGSEQVYVYVLGGNPGLSSGTNPAIGLMTALGPCNALFSQLVQVNEVTTVAAAYAFAGYATDATHVSSSGSNLAMTGLTNAGLNSQNLANVNNGLPPSTTPGLNGIVPSNNILSIANILSACINGPSGNGSCSTLFQYTKTAGASGTAATDTASAAINLAHNPYPTAAGMTALYGLVTAQPAFGGGLTSQPSDFTLGINFSDANCFNNSAHGLAIDASGSVWALGGHGMCKFSSTGTKLTSYYGFGYNPGCYAGGSNLAIDNSGNAWAANLGNSLCEVKNDGTAVSPSTGYTGGGLNSPRDVAIDAAGNVWTANFNGTLSKFASTGTAISTSSGYSNGGGNDYFYGLAIDLSGSVWAANYGTSAINKFASTGAVLSPINGYYGGGVYGPYAVKIDASGNVWTANYGNDTLAKFSSAGTAISPTANGGFGGYPGGGLNSPESLAIDSAGNVWAANENTGTVSAFTNSGTAITVDHGYNAGSGIYVPVSIALDGSGDVWVTNATGTLTELIGAGAPVVTPVVANLVSPYGAGAVNRP